MDQSHEFCVIEQCVDWIQQVILEQDGLTGQGHIEQGRLASGWSDHYLLDYIEYDTHVSRKIFAREHLS